MKNKERINATAADGNAHILNPAQEKLYRAGWRLVRKARHGGFKVVTWRHPDNSEVLGQGEAIMQQRMREGKPR